MGTLRLSYERSLALHAAVAEKLVADPTIVDRARAILEDWLSQGGGTTPLWLKWQRVLDCPVEQIAALLTERSEEAAWLRKASPFAGVLAPAERLAILREVKQRIESAA